MKNRYDGYTFELKVIVFTFGYFNIVFHVT